MVSVCTRCVDGLLEGYLNLETQAVDFDYGQWVHIQFGTDQNDASPCWMLNEDKAYPLSDGSPKEVDAAVLDRNSAFAVNRAWGRLKHLPGFEKFT